MTVIKNNYSAEKKATFLQAAVEDLLFLFLFVLFQTQSDSIVVSLLVEI